jgi:hypothetical protein
MLCASCLESADVHRALLESGGRFAYFGPLPKSGSVFISLADKDKASGIEPSKGFAALGFRILATDGTAEYLRTRGLTPTTVRKNSEGTGPLGEKTIVEMFEKEGVDMREMTLGDAKMPLYIVASNITKGVPTVFSKRVRVLDALKCSCSIPGVFKPQELYGSLYVDGGLFVPCLSQLIPDALVIFLAKKQTRVIDAKSIESMNPFDYMRCLYSMSTTHIHKFHKSPTTLELEYPGLNTDSSLEDFDLDKVMDKAAKSLNDFLGSQRLLQKVPESVGVGAPLHLK